MARKIHLCNSKGLELPECSSCDQLEGRVADLEDEMLTKQDNLVSGENIKTINGESIMGSGDLSINASSTTMTVTLASADWNNNEQTVTATGITVDDVIILSPDPNSLIDYADAGVYCSAQANDALTFTSQSTPATDLTVNIIIMGATQ